MPENPVRRIYQLLKSPSRRAEALALAEEELRKHPGEAFWLGLHGDVLRRLGRLREARTELEKALSLEPQNHRLRIYQAEYLLAERRPAEALAYLEGLPREGWTVHLLIRALREAGHLPQALAVAREALGREPENPALLRETARLLENLERPEEAEELWRRLAAISPDEAGREILRLRTGRLNPEEAEAELGRILRVGSRARDPDLHALRAEKLRGAGKNREAAEEYRKALELRPGDQRLLRQYGFSLKAAGDERAEAVLEEALDRDPNDMYVRSALLNLYRGRESRGVEYLEGLLRRHPEAVWIHGVLRRLKKNLPEEPS